MTMTAERTTRVGTDQRRTAIRKATAVRSQRANLKRDLRDGRITLDEILGAPHPAAASATLLDVLQWTRWPNGFRPTALERIGKQAVGAKVNLLLPVGRASLATRAWCVTAAEWNAREPRGEAAA